MNIPTYDHSEVIDKSMYYTRPWQILIDTLLQNLRAGLGEKGFQITPVSSNPANNQVAIVESTFGQVGGVVTGTVIFDPYEVNGSPTGRNGQLKVLLADGLFHKIPNL